MRPRVVLIHGAATTGRVWRRVVPLLAGAEVVVAERACSGDMDREVADLADCCEDAVAVGVSGGATLVVELAARGVALRAGVAHEPAAGSLAPGLLAHAAEGLRAGGVAGFGAALYGPAWTVAEAPADHSAATRDFRMFGAFEPRPPAAGCGPLLLTVGELSPPIRHASVAALAPLLRAGVVQVPGGGHAVHLQAPEAFAALVRARLGDG